MKAVVMIGCPGAGKSTWTTGEAVKGQVVISRDIMREKLGYCKPGEKTLLDKEGEAIITRECDLALAQAAKEGKDVIIDDTNLNPYFRGLTVKKLRSFGYEPHFIYVETPLEDILSRRKGQIPEEVLVRMYGQSCETKGLLEGEIGPSGFEGGIYVKGA